MENKDVIGEALLSYLNGKRGEEIKVISSIAEDDVIPVNYLFRKAAQLPEIEQKAIDLCKGKVLYVGAAAGAHSLLLQEKGLNVRAIDISKGAVEVMQQRGLKNVLHCNYFDLKEKQFDTLLFMMNGVGISGTIEGLNLLLLKAKELLKLGGQILLESTDILYFFEEEDGSICFDLNGSYYGEVSYKMEYKNCKTDSFHWLFIDFEKLQTIAKPLGFNCKMIYQGENNEYLAQLILE